MKRYTVRREVIQVEECLVEANSIKEAKQKVLDDDIIDCLPVLGPVEFGKILSVSKEDWKDE